MSGVVDRPAGWEDYWRALSEGDSASAVGVALELHRGGMDVPEILEVLVAAAQVEVGRRWAANEWNVAQEHRATSVAEDVVAALAGQVEAPQGSGTAVVSCVDGEWHSLPSRVVATVLRATGWKVHYLGASLPVAHLVQLLQDVGPDLTALSCSVPTALWRARAMVEASREAGVPVLVGGPGFGPAGRWGLRIGADGTAGTARQGAALVGSPGWPRFTDPAPPLESPDDTAGLLRRRREVLVSSAVGRLVQRWPATRRYDDHQMARTEEDMGHLVDFLAAALYVDDPRLYTDFVVWMDHVLVKRGVPTPALVAGINVTRGAVEEVLGTAERPDRYLAMALDALAG
ncbi:MAG TPA: cobalamin-dependent protein [Acidimicrobiales bacterium]|nr:cobalamin-dependent protein [Acidimicrobiales bacterium]